VNPAGRRMVGLAPDYPLESARLADFYPTNLRSYVTAVILKAIRATGCWQGETTFRHWRTGKSIPVSNGHFVVRDPDTGETIGMATITRDISQIKRAQDELAASNRRLAETADKLAENQLLLRAILDNSPSAILIKDLDGRYLRVNKQTERLSGKRESEIVGRLDFEVFPQALASRLRGNDQIVLETTAPLITEERIQLGAVESICIVSKFPLRNDAGKVFAICSIWSDITERKRAEERLAQAAADLREAQHVARVGSFTWDHDSDTAHWSDELYQLFGRDPSAGVPRLFEEDAHVFAPESLKRFRKALKRTLEDGTPYETDVEVIRPDGSTRWATARGEPIRDKNGRITGVHGTAQDVTELKQLERMREEWTSVVAHDLRQPIGVIGAAADLLPELGLSNGQERGIADRIRSAAQGLARMVDDLLDISALESKRLALQCDWVDPHEVLREVVERLAYLTSNNRVVLEDGEKTRRIRGDPMRLGQVLGNLISNAVKYGEKGGEIRIGLEQHDTEVEISVTNRGQGIPPEELARLFSRFRRSKKAHGSSVAGLGVGLYIAKGLVEAHRGRIWADSTPGETTTFHFTVPSEPPSPER